MTNRDKGEEISLYTSIYTILPVRLALLAGFLLCLYKSYFFTAYFLLLFIVILEGSRIWARAGIKNLRAKFAFSPQRMFQGEEACFSIELENAKLLPVFLSWLQPLPPGLAPFSPHGDGAAEQNRSAEQVGDKVFLGWFAGKTTSPQRIVAAKRGYYELSPLQLLSRDGFGLFGSGLLLNPPKCEVIIYPRLIPLADFYPVFAGITGEQRDRRPFLPDPVRIVGLRDYTPDTPARLINWKASARQDTMLAKVLEPSADLRICIILQAEVFLEPAGRELIFEEALSAVATLVIWAQDNKIPFGYLSNTRQSGLIGSVSIPVGSSPCQAAAVLESLARAELAVADSMDTLLQKDAAHLPWGTTLVIMGKLNTSWSPPLVRKTVYYPLPGLQ